MFAVAFWEREMTNMPNRRGDRMFRSLGLEGVSSKMRLSIIYKRN